MKKKSLLLLIPFAAAAAVALGSCGKEPGPQCDQASVILDSQAITIEINETKQLTASSNMEGCSVEVNWRSDDASIASVDQNGVVTGHKNGTTTVYANDVPCLVAVGTGRPDIPITGIELVKPASDSITMVVGDTQEVLVNVLPNEAPASDKVVNLSSSKESVVIINENGEIEAVGAGTAKVTITSEKNPDVKKVISITVEDPVIPFPSKTSDDATLVDVGPVLDGATVNFVGRYNNEYFAMDHEQTKASSSTYFKSIAATVDNDKLLLGEGSGSFFTIKNKDGSYSFKTASGKYLAAKSDKNQLLEVDAIGPDSSFNIEIVDGEATITCIDPANTEHNTLFLNQGSERFACYKSTQTYPKPHIYAKAPVPVPATGILLDKSEATIEIDGEVTLVSEVLPSYAIDKTVTWSTEDKGIVSVDNGKVKGLMAGEEIVTASTVNGKTATCKITVVSEIVPVDRIELNNTTMTLDIDDVSESLTATIFPENATFKDVVWSSSEEDIVKVDETGKLTAVGVGASTITVTSTTDSSKTASCVVSVNAAADGVVHAYNEAMSHEEGETSERSFNISGCVTFVMGKEAIIQDGDHAITVVLKSESTKVVLGKKLSMRSQVVKSGGVAKTVNISINDITVSDDEVTVNKAVIDSSEKMDTAAFLNLVDFKNVVKKTELTATSGNYSMNVAFKDNLEKTYTFYMKKALVSQAAIDEINTVKLDGEIEITNCYVGNNGGEPQLCSGTTSVVTDKSTYEPDSVYVKNGETQITSLNMAEGEEITLTAGVLPAKAPQEVTWSTEDTEIISVDNGKITALKAGSATLTVTSADGTKHTNIAVNVTENEVLVTSIELDEEAITLALDDEKQLIATVLPADATHPELVWSVEGEEDIVSLDNGKVTALKAGEVIVKASNVNSGLSASCTVTVVNKFIDVDEVDKVVLTAGAESLNLGSYGSGSNDEYAWTDLAKHSASGSIQGNYSTGDNPKDSELHNKYAYSRPIKYVKLAVGNDISANNTIEMRFGNSRMPTGDVIPMGSGTVYDITTAGTYVVIKPSEDATFFSLKNTKGATYFSSIEIGFVDYNVPLEGIQLNKESLSLVVEESFMLKATLNPSDTTHTTLTYSSDHPEIADVGTDGIISAYAPGTAIITVATDDPEISATCEVKVAATKVPVTKVELTDHKTEILQGGCTTLTATVSPDNATITDLIWSVEEGKEDIISVDEDGCVTGLQPGTAKVIVKSVDNPAAFDECEVTVEERFIDVSTMDEYVITAESLGLIGDYASDSSEYFAWTQAKADKSGNIQISGSTTPKSELHNLFGFSKDITYVVIDLASGATENATADLRFGDSVLPTENAVNLGKDTEYPLNVEGKIVIMAPEEGFDFFSLAPTKNAIYIKSITVGFDEYVEHVTGVSLNKETTTLQEGANEQLIATVSPDNADDKTVTWTSSNDSIATVVDGKVTAVSAGEATITVKTTDGEFEAKCVVTVVEKIIDVENITLDKETLSIVEGGEETVVATVTPNDATHPEHTWSSSDETVATVDQNGKVTAVGAGEATITVKVDDDESKYAECVVTVTAAVKHELPYNGSFSWDSETNSPVFPDGVWTGTGEAYLNDKVYGLRAKDEYVQSIKLFEDTTAIQVDVTSIVNTSTSAEYVVTVYALNDAGEVVSSATFNPDFTNAGSLDKVLELATTKSVVITGEGISGVKIAFTKTNSKNLALVSVNIIDVTKVSGVSLNESELTMELGETGALVATVMPETASNKNCTFSSDHPEIVSVDTNTGEIEAVGVGKATITVTTSQGSFTDTCEINVSESKVAVTGVEFAKDSITLATGDKETVDVTVSPADAYDKSVSYLSNNTSIATVDENGEITAVAPGTATITVTTTDGSFTDTCEVTVLTKTTITNTNDFPGSSYDKNNFARYAADGSGLLFETYQVNKNSGTIQFQKNAGKLWNVSPISGLSEIRFSVSAGSVTVYAGDELKTTDNVLNPVDNVYTVPAGCSYFYIVGSKDAVTNLSDIEIVYDEIPEYVIPVESVSLDKTTLDLTPTSEPVTLVPEINPSSVLNKEVIWSIKADSDDCITLENGVVTPKAVGTATVICTSAADTTKYAECVVTVSATEKKIDVTEVDTFTLTPDSLGLTGSYVTTETTTADGNFSYISAMKGNSSIQMKKDGGGELHNNYAFSREIKYVKLEISKAAADSAKASMFFGDSASPTGNEIALGSGSSYAINAVGSVVIKPAAGSTYFSLKATNGTIYFASIELGFVDYVAPAVESVTLDKTELAMTVGDDDVTLVPTFSPADAEAKSAVWASDAEGVATVTNGVVHAVAAGTANITYTVDGKVATCVVTVEASSGFNKDDYNQVTKTINFNGTITPDPLGNNSCVWTNENVSVAVNKGSSNTVVGNTDQQYIGSEATPEIRLYKGQEIVFDLADENYVILAIDVQLTNNSSSNFENSTFTNVSFEKTAGSGSIGIANPFTYSFAAKKVVTDGKIVAAGAFRISSISITYGIPKTA
ncbi:MAG: Ig-like domain-containing protein [Bacilli bacterium]|nr:Ig-like domain-containing protein [Bacilli bacterium]